MSVNAVVEAKVHQELLYFLAKHSLEKIVSNIDEIILSYLVSVVELISKNVDDDVPDVVELMEMLNAYLPGFDKIGRSEVTDWMFGLANTVMTSDQDNSLKDAGSSIEMCESERLLESSPSDNGQHDFTVQGIEFPVYDYSEISCKPPSKNVNFSCSSNDQDDTRKDYGKNSDPVIFVSSSHCKKTPHLITSMSVPKNQNLQTHSKHKRGQIGCPSQDYQSDSSETGHLANEETKIRILLEMFPATCSLEARHCFQVSAGDVDHAAQLILDRQDKGQSILQQANSRGVTAGHSHLQMEKLKKKDDCVKSCVLQKYSFVDTEEDKKTYRPLTPKGEAKKLVRYRDGQVVSMKGERFSNIEKKEDTELKDTYINLKPARKYRFH